MNVPSPVAPVAIEMALDTEHMAQLLEPLLPTPAALHDATLVDQKQGDRSVVRYHFGGAGGRAAMAKLYPDVARARRVNEIMRRLGDEVFNGSDLRVPQLVGWLPEVAMVVYWAAEGVPLDEVRTTDGAMRGARAAARWLSDLHQSRVSLDRRLELEKETANGSVWAELVGQQLPEERRLAVRLARGLSAHVPVDVQSDVPIHKDFHHQHVLVGSALTVIDLDEARLGDPNFDLGHFCANLRLLSLRSQLPDRERIGLQADFLAEYAARTGWQIGERFSYFYGYTCLKLAKQMATGRGPRPRPVGTERRRQVSTMLSEGLTCLPS